MRVNNTKMYRLYNLHTVGRWDHNSLKFTPDATAASMYVVIVNKDGISDNIKILKHVLNNISKCSNKLLLNLCRRNVL